MREAISFAKEMAEAVENTFKEIGSNPELTPKQKFQIIFTGLVTKQGALMKKTF